MILSLIFAVAGTRHTVQRRCSHDARSSNQLLVVFYRCPQLVFFNRCLWLPVTWTDLVPAKSRSSTCRGIVLPRKRSHTFNWFQESVTASARLASFVQNQHTTMPSATPSDQAMINTTTHPTRVGPYGAYSNRTPAVVIHIAHNHSNSRR